MGSLRLMVAVAFVGDFRAAGFPELRIQWDPVLSLRRAPPDWGPRFWSGRPWVFCSLRSRGLRGASGLAYELTARRVPVREGVPALTDGDLDRLEKSDIIMIAAGLSWRRTPEEAAKCRHQVRR